MIDKPFEDYDEEELEMLINGLIHPNDMFVSPDSFAGGFPGAPGAPGMPGGAASPAGSFDAMLASAYDEMDEDD